MRPVAKSQTVMTQAYVVETVVGVRLRIDQNAGKETPRSALHRIIPFHRNDVAASLIETRAKNGSRSAEWRNRDDSGLNESVLCGSYEWDFRRASPMTQRWISLVPS